MTPDRVATVATAIACGYALVCLVGGVVLFGEDGVGVGMLFGVLSGMPFGWWLGGRLGNQL